VAKLLVVEDEPGVENIFRGNYRKEIKLGKYEFIFANSGEQALEEIEKDREREIDLIIADLKMPAAKIDGREFIRILQEQHINIKIIVLTAYINEYEFSESEKENILFLLNKGTDEASFEKLTQIVDSSLDQSALITLKNLVDFSLDVPDRFDIYSQHVRLDTLLKIIKELPENKKIKLIRTLLNYSNYKTLKWLEEELPKEIEKKLDTAFRQDKLKKWLLEQQSKGKISEKIPLDKIEYFFLEARTIPNGIFYWIKWSLEGKWHSKYLPKKLIEQEMPSTFKAQIKGLPKNNKLLK
jgi:CheY-like chemotaxis protein